MAQAQTIEREITDAPARPPTRMERAKALPRSYPRAVWLMALTNLVLWTGRGMILPFTIIYFSQIANLRASLVGAGISAASLGGIVFVLFVAGQIDRRGGHPVLRACLLTIGVAMVLYPWATEIVPFLVATFVINFAGQLYWPASDATLASLTPPDRIAEAFSVLRVANAVGIGLGGLIGGAMVAGGGMSEYRLMFAVSGLVVLAALLLVWRAVPNVILNARDDAGKLGSWRDVLPDREFVYFNVVLFLLVFGFSQLTVTVPAFLRQEAGVGEGAIGLLFTINTLLVVVSQVPIAGWVNRSNLGRIATSAGIVWAVAFAAMLLTTASGLPAAAGVFVLFTAAELLFMPFTAVVPVRLAPQHLRGRYFAMTSITWGGSWAFATLAGGFALDMSRPALFWPFMAGFMLLGALAALRMARSTRLGAA